jgi:hypothetical protein
MILLLAACVTPPSDEPVDTDTGTPATEVPLDWGVVDDCDHAPAGTFDDWYAAGRGIIVHGSSEADRALAERVLAWYSGFGPTLELRDAAELTEEDRAENLIILGSPDTNPVLMELNGALPVWFEDGRFTFGGYRYDEHGNGIALLSPNPWNPDGHVLLYAGNSYDGAYAMFTVPTGGTDYVTTRGRGVVMQSGSLCRGGDIWGWKAGSRWEEDDRADWELWKESLETTEEPGGDPRFTYSYLPGSRAATDVDALLAARAADYDHVLATLDLDALDEPIVGYLYSDNETKGDVTGNDGNGHANDLNYEVHEVYGDEVTAATGHEDVHVIAWHRIGATNYALMGEGLAVAMGGVWWDEPLDTWASRYADDGTLPPLTTLMNDFWSESDAVTYPVAGHFVTFLLDGWGPDTVKALYVAEDLDAAFEDELGMTTAEVEAAWWATIP